MVSGQIQSALKVGIFLLQAAKRLDSRFMLLLKLLHFWLWYRDFGLLETHGQLSITN